MSEQQMKPLFERHDLWPLCGEILGFGLGVPLTPDYINTAYANMDPWRHRLHVRKEASPKERPTIGDLQGLQQYLVHSLVPMIIPCAANFVGHAYGLLRSGEGIRNKQIVFITWHKPFGELAIGLLLGCMPVAPLGLSIAHLGAVPVSLEGLVYDTQKNEFCSAQKD